MDVGAAPEEYEAATTKSPHTREVLRHADLKTEPIPFRHYSHPKIVVSAHCQDFAIRSRNCRNHRQFPIRDLSRLR